MSAPIDPRDIAAVAVQALTMPNHLGRTYTLTGPELLSAAEQVQIISNAIGKPLRIVETLEAQAREGMLRSGVPAIMVNALLELLQAVSTGSDAVLTTAIRDVTGQEPRRFQAWVADHLQAFQPA